MRKNIVKATLLILLAMPLQSFAAGWSPFLKVKEVYTYSTGFIFITLDPSGGAINPDGCTYGSIFRVDANQTNNDHIYKMALTAKASGQTVSAYLGGCDGAYPKLLHMRLRD